MEVVNNSFYAFEGDEFLFFKFDGKLNNRKINLPNEF